MKFSSKDDHKEPQNHHESTMELPQDNEPVEPTGGPLYSPPIKMTAQIYRISTTPDGGARIVLETGSDSLTAVQELMRIYAKGDVNLALAFIEIP